MPEPSQNSVGNLNSLSYAGLAHGAGGLQNMFYDLPPHYMVRVRVTIYR